MSLPSEVRRLYNALVNAQQVRYGVFPTSADGVAAAAITLTAAAVAWTWGAWTQVVLAAGVLADNHVWGFTLENFVGAVAQGEVQIGIGVAPAGVLLGVFPIGVASLMLPHPLYVLAGNGIVARYRTATGVADTVDIKVLTRTGF